MTTTVIGPQSEWTAAPLRPTARWAPVSGPDGRTRLEMTWSVPAPSAADAVSPGTATSTHTAA